MKYYKKYLPYILAVLIGVIYLFTAAPFMLWLDAPRFVSAIVTLGVANPPEPLYIMLAKPFTYIPFGSYIFRIQAFSALTAVAALIMLYRLILLLLKKLVEKPDKSDKTYLAALFGAGTLAFSYQFWSQAQNVETFILVVCLELIVLYLLVSANTKKSFFINLSLIALIMGFATGTNPVIASIIPAILWMMWRKRKYLSIPAFAVWIIIGVAATILIHLYIPIRAQANPFLNYWRATNLENVISVSTGAGLNVYVPELGRVNGFTGSPEVFFKSTWHFIAMWFVKFTPAILPFIVAGAVFLWKRNRFYFYFLFSIVITNWIFSSLYFSGNQESWFLVSDVAWVILAGVGFFWAVISDWSYVTLKFPEILKLLKYKKQLFLVLLIPLIFWSPKLYRRNWTLTEDYIQNLYKPIGDQKAIIFGSSDLYDSISFYVHDIPGTSVYKPNVIPITDNLLYILKWYRDNLKTTTDLRLPDDSNLKYDSANEYSNYVNEFFAQNIDKYKIFITTPAIRNNFLHVYDNKEDLSGSLKIGDQFKLVPQGLLFQVVPKEANVVPDPKNFEFTFRNGFPKNKPKLWEQTYEAELKGVVNEFAYSLESLGDDSLKSGKADDAFKFYQKAFEFNPNNAEIISRLGNFYGSTGNHQKALEYFEKALKIEPKNIGLLFNVAISYENTGRVDKAIANLNKVLQFSKQNSQIGQLAKARLDILKQSTPSAQANKGGDIQSQLLPQSLPEGMKQYANKELNLQFVYPSVFEITNEAKNIVRMSNNLKGKDELTMQFFSRKLTDGEDLESFSQKLPIKIDGPVLITQPLQIAGFEAIGKTIGSGEHLTFVLLLKNKDQAIAVKIYPGDTNKSEQLNQILQNIKTF